MRWASVVRIAREAPHDDGGAERAERPKPPSRIGRRAGGSSGKRGAMKRLATGQHRVRHRAQRIEVAARIDVPFARRLFRRHEVRVPMTIPGRETIIGVHDLRNAEVRQDRATRFGVDENIDGLMSRWMTPP